MVDKRRSTNTDYETYREIMGELLRPIAGSDLDAETLKRLYESKLVYLENLRIQCFRAINANPPAKPAVEAARAATGHFTRKDYALILEAVATTRAHLRQVMLVAIRSNFARKAANDR